MLKKIFFLTASIWTSIVLYLCLKNMKDSELLKIDIENLDKYVHIIFHFILATAWFLFFKVQFLSKKRFNPFLLSFLFSFILGILIEYLQQYYTTTRSGDVFDIFANMFGASLGLLFCVLINHRFFKSNIII